MWFFKNKFNIMYKYNRCRICNSKIFRKASELKRSKSGVLFCCKKCFHVYSRKLRVCKFCKKPTRSSNLTCGSECFSKLLSSLRTKRHKINRKDKPEQKCLNCSNSIGNNVKFCSQKCCVSYKNKSRIDITIKSGVLHESSVTNLSSAKKVLISIRGHRCEICKIDTWMNEPVPLVYDHIDGNCLNGTLANARLVCGNCDMQLPTYKSKNKKVVESIEINKKGRVANWIGSLS